jgi:dienelactone hydrolase
VSAKEEGGVTIKDINYAAYNARHGRIRAYLIEPKGAGPHAGVVFFHWLGRTKSDRSQFLDEATALAKQGVVSLLIQGYFQWLEPPTDGGADRQQVIDQTIEVRRALDLLLSQPEVDPRRIGYVGHDYGAMYGAIVAGLEKRAKAYVLMAGMGSFSDWSLKYWPATAKRGEVAYRHSMKAVDPIHYVSHASPAALFFQFANSDVFIPKAAATAFFEKASRPKQDEWYDSAHDLNVEAARSDRREWLARQLGLAVKTEGDELRFCTNVGPVTLTIKGGTITGRYRLLVTPRPKDGTIRGVLKGGLLDAVWDDPDGTGRIIFGFASDLSRFTAIFNNHREPSHWFEGGWSGVSTTKLGEVSEERRRAVRCE